MPLAAPPPRKPRSDRRWVLSRVHWVEPKLVAEITYLTWTGDGLLHHTVFLGLRIGQARRTVLGGRSRDRLRYAHASNVARRGTPKFPDPPRRRHLNNTQKIFEVWGRPIMQIRMCIYAVLEPSFRVVIYARRSERRS